MENPTGSVDESPARRTVIITPRLSISTDTSSWHCTRLGQTPHYEATSAPVRSARSWFLFLFFYLFVSPPPRSITLNHLFYQQSFGTAGINPPSYLRWLSSGWSRSSDCTAGRERAVSCTGTEGGGRDRRRSNRWAASVQNNQRWISQVNVKRHTDFQQWNHPLCLQSSQHIPVKNLISIFDIFKFIQLYVCLALLSSNFYYTG